MSDPGEKKRSGGEGDGAAPKKKKKAEYKWLQEGVWSIHEGADGKTYYHNWVRWREGAARPVSSLRLLCVASPRCS